MEVYGFDDIAGPARYSMAGVRKLGHVLHVLLKRTLL